MVTTVTLIPSSRMLSRPFLKPNGSMAAELEAWDTCGAQIYMDEGILYAVYALVTELYDSSRRTDHVL